MKPHSKFGMAVAVRIADPTALAGALSAIMESAVCNATLTPAPSSANDLTVTYQDSPIPPDQHTGWSYDSMYGRLRLHGPACQDVLFGWSNLKVTATCPSGRPGTY